MCICCTLFGETRGGGLHPFSKSTYLSSPCCSGGITFIWVVCCLIQEVDENSDRKRETACKRPGKLSKVHALPLTHYKSRDNRVWSGARSCIYKKRSWKISTMYSLPVLNISWEPQKWPRHAFVPSGPVPTVKTSRWVITIQHTQCYIWDTLKAEGEKTTGRREEACREWH